MSLINPLHISVGAGKSSLISSLLGEMYKSSGEVHLRGSIAYVPQTPWIMNATLRDNITFGKHFDVKFYERELFIYSALNEGVV
jgi:ABC-type multidrug transport system fused ATPase/permease subunit